MLRIRRRHAGTYTITAEATDAAGVPLTVDDPSVKVFDGLGAEIGTYTPEGGALSVEIPVADLPHLDTYEAHFTGSVGGEPQEWRVSFQLVGDHYFDLATIRAAVPELASAHTFPDSTLRLRRAEAEDDFEAMANRAFVARGHIVRKMGGDTHVLVPHRDVIRVTGALLDGDPLEVDDVTVNPVIGSLELRRGWPAGLLTIRYEHGRPDLLPAVAPKVMKLARIYTIPSAIDPRATAVINADIGGYRLSVASDGKLGIPDIDEAARRYGDNTPAVG